MPARASVDTLHRGSTRGGERGNGGRCERETHTWFSIGAKARRRGGLGHACVSLFTSKTSPGGPGA